MSRLTALEPAHESSHKYAHYMFFRVCHQLQNQMKQEYSLAVEAYSTGRNAGFA